MLIHESVNNKTNWEFRAMGFMFLGMIAESCTKTFKKNLDDTIRMNAMGLIDAHPIVRFNALMSLGLLLNVLSPDVQEKFHKDMFPLLIKMMRDDSLIKLKSQAVSCCVNFVRGLINGDEDAEMTEEDIERNKKVVLGYSEELVSTISSLFQLSVE